MCPFHMQPNMPPPSFHLSVLLHANVKQEWVLPKLQKQGRKEEKRKREPSENREKKALPPWD